MVNGRYWGAVLVPVGRCPWLLLERCGFACVRRPRLGVALPGRPGRGFGGGGIGPAHPTHAATSAHLLPEFFAVLGAEILQAVGHALPLFFAPPGPAAGWAVPQEIPE